MRKNITIPIAMVFVAVLALLIAVRVGDDETPLPDEIETGVAETQFVRADSHRISDAPASALAFVEFLDFECEACRAAHPAIAELRAEYGDDVAFIVRNFPLHNNSEAAAQAAEAAAAQGKYIEMVDLLFETQPEWGEQDISQEAVFFGFAEQLGLDMESFRDVYEDPATIDKIRRDKSDGLALGVAGTPTFFLDGEKLEPSSFDELVTAVEDAISR